MASDAFVVGEDWISEHYFNTESTKQSFQSRVGALRKSWDERAKDGEQTPSSRLSAVRRDLLSALASEATDTAAYDSAVLTPLTTALGYADARWHRTVTGPVTIVAPADTPDSPAGAIVRARRVDDSPPARSSTRRGSRSPWMPSTSAPEARPSRSGPSAPNADSRRRPRRRGDRTGRRDLTCR